MSINHKDIKNLLQKEDPVVLEIGAHKGEDTVKFLKEFKDIKIYCFEPDPRCITAFKENIQDSRCALIEAAVCNENGKAVLYISGGWPVVVPALIKASGLVRPYTSLVSACRALLGRKREWDESSSIKQSFSNPECLPWLTFDKTVIVQAMKLDTFTQEHNIDFIDFVWSDVQGAERDMIEGAAKTLDKVKYLYIEYGWKSCYSGAMTREETIGSLETCDFKISSEYPDNPMVGNLLFINRKFI